MNSEYREAHYGKYLRTHSRMSRIDLNVVSIFNQEPEETSVNSSRQIEPTSNQGGNRPPTIIDIEAISDDVIILSPRSFAEARDNSLREHRRPIVVDLDSEDCTAPTNINKHGRSSNRARVNCDLSLTLGGSSSSKVRTIFFYCFI
ncbi:hypothetical protein Leryth_022440 [Lithospermum erythrorhizon]|nr:hypothetical protein Leryth_022440 [Lithospermum erythrorhizon]